MSMMTQRLSYEYRDSILIPDTAQFAEVVEMKQAIEEVGEASIEVDSSRLNFMVEAENLWDLRDAVAHIERAAHHRVWEDLEVSRDKAIQREGEQQ